MFAGKARSPTGWVLKAAKAAAARKRAARPHEAGTRKKSRIIVVQETNITVGTQITGEPFGKLVKIQCRTAAIEAMPAGQKKGPATLVVAGADAYGGEILQLSVGATSALTALLAGGSLLAFGLAARLLSALSGRPDLGRRVSQIDVADAHDAVVLLEGETALIHLGEERFAERLQSYVELAPALHERVPDIDYVDLRFDDRVYVRPGGKDGTATPVARRD